MAVGMWRGVSNVARKQKKRYKGVSNVARTIKKRWRGVNNVARLTFQDEPVLYENGNNYAEFELGTDGSPAFGTDAITFTNACYETSVEVMLDCAELDLSTGYSAIKITLKVTGRASSSATKVRGIIKLDTVMMYAPLVDLTLDEEVTITRDISDYTGVMRLQIALQGENASESSAYKISGEIYKIWLEE